MSKYTGKVAQGRLNKVYLKIAREDAWTSQGGCCLYCHAPLTRVQVTAEHRTPRSKGGTNRRANIDAACADCNLAKGGMPATAFKAAIKDTEYRGNFRLYMAGIRRRVHLSAERACRRIYRSVGLAA